MADGCLDCEEKDEQIRDLIEMGKMGVRWSTQDRLADLEKTNSMLLEDRDRAETGLRYLEATIVLCDFWMRLRYLFTRKLGNLDTNAKCETKPKEVGNWNV